MPVATRPLFDLTVVSTGPRWRVAIRGELDLASGQDLKDVVEVLLAANGVRIDIDLAGVTFIDTAGWEAVAVARRLVTDTGGVSNVVAGSAVVTRFVDLIDGLDHLLTR
jgi:anti-sigma B factor antagonist